MGPVVAAYDVEKSRERRLVIAYKQGGTRSFFSALSDLYHSYGFYSTRKYVGELPFFAQPQPNFGSSSRRRTFYSENFKNGVTIISLYLHPLQGPPSEASIIQIIKESSLICEFLSFPLFPASRSFPSPLHTQMFSPTTLSSKLIRNSRFKKLPTLTAVGSLLNTSSTVSVRLTRHSRTSSTRTIPFKLVS